MEELERHCFQIVLLFSRLTTSSKMPSDLFNTCHMRAFMLASNLELYLRSSHATLNGAYQGSLFFFFFF